MLSRDSPETPVWRNNSPRPGLSMLMSIKSSTIQDLPPSMIPGTCDDSNRPSSSPVCSPTYSPSRNSVNCDAVSEPGGAPYHQVTDGEVVESMNKLASLIRRSNFDGAGVHAKDCARVTFSRLSVRLPKQDPGVLLSLVQRWLFGTVFKSTERIIINECSGVCHPGEITAILGGSGGGLSHIYVNLC